MTRVLTRRLPGQGLDKAEAAELSVSASQGTIWPFPGVPNEVDIAYNALLRTEQLYTGLRLTTDLNGPKRHRKKVNDRTNSA